MAGLIGAALCTVAVALPAQAQLGEAQRVKVSSTGLGAERVKTVPIGRRPGQKPRVAMSLSPDELGNAGPGDSVWGGAEVEVSVTCLEPMRQCIGRIYHYSPLVRAKLVLAGSPTAAGGGTLPIGKAKGLRCSQEQPHRNHHCVVVVQATRQLPKELPCGRCHLNLVVDASHPSAKRGHLLVVGVDSKAGTVDQKKGMLNGAVFSGPRPKVPPSVAAKRSTRRVPIGVQKRIVMSKRIDDLREGEQLIVDAKTKVKISHLRYAALVQSFLVLSESPTSTVRTGLPSKVAYMKGKLSARNGFNCTPGPSGHGSPCTVRKLAVVKILKDVRRKPDAPHPEDRGPLQPLYVNLVVGTQAMGVNRHRHRAGDKAKIGGGSIAVTRYGPEYR